jgi:hypothetical protein
VIVGLLEASYFLAELVDGEGTSIYPPAPAYSLAQATGVDGAFLRLLNVALANLRVARVRLSSATPQDSLEIRLLSPEHDVGSVASFSLVAPTPAFSPSPTPAGQPSTQASRSGARPQRVLFSADPQEGDKLVKSTRALRLTRSALRQLECVERQAELARAAIAGQRIAHHALRDYRTKANRHVTVATNELQALIRRTASLEDLEPEIPGRKSPEPQIPSTLGELPVPAVSEEAAIDIRRFSQEDFAEPSPAKTSAGLRAKRAAAQALSPPSRPDKRPAPTSPPPEASRPATRARK